MTSDPLDAEDAKLVTLARAARARTGAAEGAAVRDEAGRTYAAATVTLPSLRLSAFQAAVAAAVSSGSQDLAAGCVLTDAQALTEIDVAVAADVGIARPFVVTVDGTVRPT